MYEVITSTSMLLPSDFRYNDVQVKQNIFIKPDIDAQVVAKSVNEKDMTIYKNRMEKRMNGNKTFDFSADSLGF